jgi:pimeloyl-ACP methyl ester carboxylesterase
MTTTAHRQIAAFDAVSTVRRDIRRLLSGTAHVLSRIAWITVLALGALSSTNSLAVKAAEPGVFPAGFRTEDIQTDGATIHVRVGGAGPALLAIHGFGDTGDMWAPLAQALMAQHTIIAPDLRGMGLSSHPPGGYDKKTQAADLARVLDALNVREVDLVTHDIGNMVGYAFAAQYPDRVKHYVAMDAPLPGIGPWDEQLRNPKVWHFNFRGPDVERLVQGRERIYLDRFWNELSAHPESIDETTRDHYARLYARPRNMHCAFEQFAAFGQDATDNKAFAARGKLAMPVLAIGAEKSFGTAQADVLRFVASDVTGQVIADSGHWLMEEQPAATVAALEAFLHK